MTPQRDICSFLGVGKAAQDTGTFGATINFGATIKRMTISTFYTF